MAKVCDKCNKKLVGNGTIVDLQGIKYEVCDGCISKIIRWLTEPIKEGIFRGLFNK